MDMGKQSLSLSTVREPVDLRPSHCKRADSPATREGPCHHRVLNAGRHPTECKAYCSSASVPSKPCSQLSYSLLTDVHRAIPQRAPVDISYVPVLLSPHSIQSRRPVGTASTNDAVPQARSAPVPPRDAYASQPLQFVRDLGPMY